MERHMLPPWYTCWNKLESKVQLGLKSTHSCMRYKCSKQCLHCQIKCHCQAMEFAIYFFLPWETLHHVLKSRSRGWEANNEEEVMTVQAFGLTWTYLGSSSSTAFRGFLPHCIPHPDSFILKHSASPRLSFIIWPVAFGPLAFRRDVLILPVSGDPLWRKEWSWQSCFSCSLLS